MTRFFRRFRGPSSSNTVQGRKEVYDDEPSDLNTSVFPMKPPLPYHWGQPYQWHEIFSGTLNFQQTLLLGRGNFGRVYRCHFSRTNEDGAVKIQDRTGIMGHEEFLREIMALRTANHRNVIKLLGRCYGRRNRAIIYELMPNGSLDRHIFGKENLIKPFQLRHLPSLLVANERLGQGPRGLQQPARVLDWDTRMNIALGVAEALAYTHQVLNLIHRDVKTGNILLDANFVPKLSDFGSATKISVDQNGHEMQTLINPIKRTLGWMAPETEHAHLVSTKSDVYSYGIFLFVLFTGKKAYDPQKSVKITDWFMREWGDSGHVPFDDALRDMYSVEGLENIYDTAWMCVDPKPKRRLYMSTVVWMVLHAASFPAHDMQNRRPVSRPIPIPKAKKLY